MPLNNYKLGDLIEACDERNSNNELTLLDVRGISTDKKFIETKANMTGVSLANYKIVKDNEFAYVADTSRRGDKIALAYNDAGKNVLISSIYTVFKVSKPELLLPNYLFMFFNRPEFDRLARFNSWGSARETFSWDDFCNTSLSLPPLPIQQKYVDVYTSLMQNAKAFEAGAEDLKLVCDGFIEDLRRKMPSQKIGEFIERVDVRNHDGEFNNVKNVSVYKRFNDVTSKVDKSNLTNYKVVMPREISFVQTTHNEKVFCNAMNATEDSILVTSVNEVFRCNESKLLPEYLCMNFNRKEFDRYARFHSWGSARETFTWADMCEVKIPIPPLETQKSIVNIFNAMNSRKKMAEELRQKIKEICPVLIKGSIEEGKGA